MTGDFDGLSGLIRFYRCSSVLSVLSFCAVGSG